MNDNINIEAQAEVRKNFEGTVYAMQALGVSTSNGEGLIRVNVYDPEEGMTILDTIVIDKYNAIRLFGDLYVYDVDIEDNMLRYTLVAREEV